MSFREYVLTRRYDYGRGSQRAWAFIARLRGSPALPDFSSWRELHAYLRTAGVTPHDLDSARVVWRSYQSRKSRAGSNEGNLGWHFSGMRSTTR
jgi:hypothetical protein